MGGEAFCALRVSIIVHGLMDGLSLAWIAGAWKPVQCHISLWMASKQCLCQKIRNKKRTTYGGTTLV